MTKESTKSQNNNMTLWDAVCTTDPAMTTRVAQRGGFTAIDSYFTIQRLTEMFGPLGEGWGWDADFEFNGPMIVCRARFWYERNGKRSTSVPLLTMEPFISTDKSGKPRHDDDAGKKALTDAITKWASYLGFSADVFLGKFDDNKYVQAVNAKLRAEEEERSRQAEILALEDEMQLAIESVEDAGTYAKAREHLIPCFLRLKALDAKKAGQYEVTMMQLKSKFGTPKDSEAA